MTVIIEKCPLGWSLFPTRRRSSHGILDNERSQTMMAPHDSGGGQPRELFAYLTYRDATGAVAWLQHVLGFRLLNRQLDGATLVHAELGLGDAVVMVAAADAGYVAPPLRDRSTGGGLYIYVDDVQSLFEDAVDAGAAVVFAPESTEWGTQRCRLLDPEGHEWSFGNYRPGGTS
jgi:uncharacterized glyoxalase superfamily protein PhnB